jgi:hypothetical protein
MIDLEIGFIIDINNYTTTRPSHWRVVGGIALVYSVQERRKWKVVCIRGGMPVWS